MRLLADENTDTEWLRALSDDGHDVRRVVDADSLSPGAADPAVLAAAAEADRVLLTADRSDFPDPPRDDHAGIVIVADPSRSGGAVRRAVRRIERAYPELDGSVAYVGDWL
jgi:hypothetical protein